MSSVTDEALQDMTTGFASCTGELAGYQSYSESQLRFGVLHTASECGLTSALTPLSLSTCMGAAAKIREMSSSCGEDDDDDDNDGDDDDHTPRTPATCASDACAGFMSSVTDEALQDMTTGFASCTGEFAGYQSISVSYLTRTVLHTASECGLTSTLQEESAAVGGNELSSGAIAGILVGCLVGAALLIGAAVLLKKKLQQSRPEEDAVTVTPVHSAAKTDHV